MFHGRSPLRATDLSDALPSPSTIVHFPSTETFGKQQPSSYLLIQAHRRTPGKDEEIRALDRLRTITSASATPLSVYYYLGLSNTQNGSGPERGCSCTHLHQLSFVCGSQVRCFAIFVRGSMLIAMISCSMPSRIGVCRRLREPGSRGSSCVGSRGVISQPALSRHYLRFALAISAALCSASA